MTAYPSREVSAFTPGARAKSFAELIADHGLSGLRIGPVDLGGGRPPLIPGYETGSIAAIVYNAGAVPDDAAIATDLGRMLHASNPPMEPDALRDLLERADLSD